MARLWGTPWHGGGVPDGLALGPPMAWLWGAQQLSRSPGCRSSASKGGVSSPVPAPEKPCCLRGEGGGGVRRSLWMEAGDPPRKGKGSFL